MPVTDDAARPPVAARLPAGPWGYAAAGWSLAFAAAHLYWALGGALGLAESAGERLAVERPTWFVLGGLYGVAVVLLGTAALGVLLGRGAPTGQRGRVLCLLTMGVAAVLLLRAVGVELVLLADPDPGYGNGAVSPAQRFWTLVLWNPWFLLGGALFGLAARAAHPGGRLN